MEMVQAVFFCGSDVREAELKVTGFNPWNQMENLGFEKKREIISLSSNTCASHPVEVLLSGQQEKSEVVLE